MTDKVVLLIDMDGVLCDWYGRVLETYKARYPDRVHVAREEVTRFYVEELYPEEHKDDIVAIAREKGFYLSLDPMAGALEALKDIEENCLDFIDPFICTSPEVEYEDLMCHSEKVQWTQKHLGAFWVKRTIITKDKTLVIGDYIIDDKPEIKGALKPVWKQLHLEQPYTPADARHVFKWSDWAEKKKYFLTMHEIFKLGTVEVG